MSIITNQVDILNQRTTNINVRISPMLKMTIIEHGTKMGVNLTDYINYVLTKSMVGQMAIESTPQYKELLDAYETLETASEQCQKKASMLSKNNESLSSQLRASQAELSKYEERLLEAQETLEAFRLDYNEQRPHSALTGTP